tara:strand:+ start:1070 stop:1270 length:201 start_codon:yes stop_codon:yes gene_type:complete
MSWIRKFFNFIYTRVRRVFIGPLARKKPKIRIEPKVANTHIDTIKVKRDQGSLKEVKTEWSIKYKR